MFIFFTNFLFSQNGNLSLTWDIEVGCQNYSYDDEKRISLEDISDSFCLQMCEFSQIHYELVGDTETIQSVEWFVAGGNLTPPITDMTENSIIWDEFGFGTLQLDIYYTNGTTQTKTICIEKIHTPKADFELLGIPFGTIVCSGQDITFVNTSQPSGGSEIVSYLWNFGDGTYSSTFQPTHSYSANGDYTVKLTATNACNCQFTVSYIVNVRKRGINITCASVACEGQKATYSVLLSEMSGCPIQQSWWTVVGGLITNYTNSNSEIEVLWNDVPESGFGQVSFNNTLCPLPCTSISSIEIPIIKINGKITGEAIACGSTQYRYKLPQWPTTEFTWSIDDGGTGATLIPTDQRNEVIISTQNQGVIFLYCNYNNTLLNCGGNASIKINVYPSASISGNEIICENGFAEYSLVDNDGVTYEGSWTLIGPGTNETGTGLVYDALFGMAGSYILTVEGEGFCKPQPKIITVSPTPPQPDSIIGNSEICAGTPIVYSVASPQFGCIYEWEVVNSSGAVAGVFYGGNFGESVTVAFLPAFASYEVKVKAKKINEPFCESAYTILNVSKIIPIFQITGTQNICASTSSNYSTTYDAADEYFWSINPSVAGSITQNPANPAEISVLWNNYTGPSVPQVKLRIRKCNTTFDAPNLNINLLFSPEIILTAPPTICKGVPVTVNINSIPALTSFDHIDWSFGDGTTITVYPTSGSFLTSPPHTYTTAITTNTDYDISAVVYGANGCIYPATGVHTITVLPTIQAAISPAATFFFCEGQPSSQLFTVNVQIGVGGASGIKWYYNGVLIPEANDLSQIDASSPGLYYAIVENANGCFTQTNTNEIIQEPCEYVNCTEPTPPTIHSSQTGCTTFTAAVGFIPSPTPDEIYWEITGGGFITSQNSTSCVFNFTEPGRHIITYTYIYYVGDQECKFQRRRNVLMPYKADMKYTVACTETPNMYAVNLLDHSVVVEEYPITNYKYLYNGIWNNNGTNPNVLINLPPGVHYVGIKIERSGYPTCEYLTSINLPNYPTANFTYTSSTCPNEPIQFTALDTDDGNTYLWDFGDGSQNFQQNPVKEYQNASDAIVPINVSLTVTNTIGCSTTFSPTGINDISVYGVNMNGNIFSNPTNALVCEGLSVLLTFNSSGSQTPSYYEWYIEDELIATTTTPTYNATQNGAYWLQGINTNGCKTSLGLGRTVTIIPNPNVVINGPISACVDTMFKLDGYLGGNAVYEWSLDGVLVSNDATGIIEVVQSTPGFYTYQLQVGIPNGTSGFCYSTSSHTIEILEVIESPTVEIDTTSVTCNPFSVTLDAFTSQPGTFNWSNGGNGSSITVTNGGPFSVRFTNAAGCTSVTQIDVPKPASFYSWIFPRGCYNLCPEDVFGSLIGPIIPFAGWQWLINGHVVDSGTNSVVNELNVIESGSYQLGLATALCPMENTISANFNLNNECKEFCNITTTVQTITPQTNDDGTVFYIVKLNFNNISGGSSYVTINNLEGGGVFIPSGIMIPAGASSSTFVMIPPFDFVSGTLNFYLNGILDGEPCYEPITLTILEQGGNKIKNPDASNFLYAAPNPVTSSTTIFYSYQKESFSNQKIVIYDLSGKTIKEILCDKNNNAVSIDCSDLPSGVYSVLLLNNGTIINQTKFIKQ